MSSSSARQLTRTSVCSEEESDDIVFGSDVDRGWQNELHYSEKAKLHLARALIMNPEVMTLQRPLHHFHSADVKELVGLVQRHVQERGVCMKGGLARDRRRPRTVFISVE